MQERKGLTLALGGGGLKCYAQLGVMEVLEQSGLGICGIAATSGGAILAAFYGLGMSPTKITDIISKFNIPRLLKATRSDRHALFGLQKLRAAFAPFFQDRRIEELQIPVAFPTVDLDKHRLHVLKKGALLDAVLAAIAIPGLLPPQQHENKVLIDGGVLSPVPVQIARSLSPNSPVIAIALMPDFALWQDHPFPQLLNAVPWLRFFSRLRFTQALGMYVRAMDMTHRQLAETRMQLENPDVVIRPDVNHVGLFDTIDLETLVKAGERAAMEHLDEIRLLGFRGKAVQA